MKPAQTIFQIKFDRHGNSPWSPDGTCCSMDAGSDLDMGNCDIISLAVVKHFVGWTHLKQLFRWNTKEKISMAKKLLLSQSHTNRTVPLVHDVRCGEFPLIKPSHAWRSEMNLPAKTLTICCFEQWDFWWMCEEITHFVVTSNIKIHNPYFINFDYYITADLCWMFLFSQMFSDGHWCLWPKSKLHNNQPIYIIQKMTTHTPRTRRSNISFFSLKTIDPDRSFDSLRTLDAFFSRKP